MCNDELISVIIPTYGRADLLGGAITSVLSQNYNSVEAIVVDDNEPGSEYGRATEQLMQKYMTDHRVCYVKNTNNMGGCMARNNGVANASGIWIAFLDDDDYFLPDYLSEMHDRAIETGVDMVYLDSAYCDDSKHVYRSKKRTTNLPEGDIFISVLEGKCPISIFTLVRKERFLEVGGFDNSLAGYQDFDLWMKLTKCCKAAACTTAHAVYRRDFRQRITSNTDKRERDFNVVTEKWRCLLTDEERVCFQGFCAAHRKQILLRRIFETKSIHEKNNYYKKYKSLETNRVTRIKMLVNSVLDKRINTIAWFTKQTLFRRYEEIR